jgi:hypothetical protein
MCARLARAPRAGSGSAARTRTRWPVQAGFLPGVCGAPWPTQYAGRNVAGGAIQPEEFDPFHELILYDEARVAARQLAV